MILESATWLKGFMMWQISWRRGLKLGGLWGTWGGLIVDPIGCGGQLGQGLTGLSGAVARCVGLHDGTDGAALGGLGSWDGYFRVEG